MSDRALSAEIPFRELINVLVRRRGLILVTAGVLTTLICFGVLLISFQYTAKALLEIEAQQAGLVGGRAGVFEQPADEPSVQTELTAITAQDNLRDALASLLNDPAFRAADAKVQQEATITGGTWWHRASEWLRSMWLNLIGASGKFTLPYLERHLQVYQERGSHVIAVAFKSTSPVEAALVANRVAQLYVERRGDQKRAATDRAITWLNDRIPQIKNEVERFETAAREYQAAHHFADTKRTAVTDQQLTDLSRQLSEAKTDLAARQTRLANVQNARSHGTNIGAVLENLDAPALAELHRRELGLLQSEADLGVTFSETNPRMQQIRSQLREIRQQMNREIDRAVANLTSETQVAAARVDSLQQRLNSLEAASTDVHLRTLEREAEASRQLYETLIQRREELNQQRQSLSAGVHVLSLAWPPSHPSSPNPLLFIIPALIASLIIGSLLAILREQLDRTMRSERDVLDVLGAPCLGLIPQVHRLAGKRPHDYVRTKPFDPYTEAIRSLVATLQITVPKRAPKTILISSSVPGEGKTTLAVSFATYAAVVGKRVLLVDLDFRHPEIMREIGGEAGKGILDFIQYRSLSSEVIQHDPTLQVDYLPIGRLPVDPLTPFAGDHLARLFLQLRDRYDCIVIDSAPILAITEARVLASMVDKVVFAVKWGSTRREVARNALSSLRSLGLADKDQPDLAGVVITQVNLRKHARYRYGDTGEVVMRYKKYYTSES